MEFFKTTFLQNILVVKDFLDNIAYAFRVEIGGVVVPLIPFFASLFAIFVIFHYISSRD